MARKTKLDGTTRGNNNEEQSALESYKRMMEGSRKGAAKTQRIAQLAHKRGLSPRNTRGDSGSHGTHH